MKLNPDKIISWIKSEASRNHDYVLAGIDDDDCSILNVADETEIIVTSDFLNSNPIAIQQGFGTLFDLGRLLVAANISDLLGTGAKPFAFSSSLMLKKGSNEEDFKKLVKGILFELDKLKVPLIGGDTKLGTSLCLQGTAIGTKYKDSKLFPKNNAKIGDYIFISGNAGSVSAGLCLLDSESNDHALIDWAKKKILEPVLPIELSRNIAKLKIANAGTDLSDGVCADLFDLCSSSGVGSILYPELIPVENEVRDISRKLNIPSWSFPLTIGGDFQFIFTANRKYRDRITNLGATFIGEISEKNEFSLSINDSLFTMPTEGHEDSRNLSFAEEVKYLLSQFKSLNDDK